MKPIPYNLEIFDDVIFGQRVPEKLTEKHRNVMAEFLKETVDQGLLLSLVNYQKTNDVLLVKEVDEISNAHPLAREYFLNQGIDYDQSESTDAYIHVLQQLNLNPKEVHISHREQHLAITRNIEWCSLSFDRLKYCYFNILLKNEMQALRKSINANLLFLQEREKAQFCVQQLFRTFQGLSFQIARKHELCEGELPYSVKTEYTDKDIYALIFKNIEKMLRFMESSFFHLIDLTSHIPHKSNLYFSYELLEKKELIKKVLTNSKIHPDLCAAILTPLYQATHPTLIQRITYTELNYFQCFSSRLAEHCSADEVSERGLFKLLLELNFNSPALIEFILHRINEKLDAAKNDVKRKEILLLALKLVNQVSCCSKISFNPNLHSAKHLVCDWIEQEILFLDRNLIRVANKIETEVKNEIIKLTSGLNVGQLALLFKLLSETGIILNSNQQEILKSIALNFQTSKVHEISITSLKNRYYNFDSKTVEGLKSKLIEMLNLLQKK